MQTVPGGASGQAEPHGFHVPPAAAHSSDVAGPSPNGPAGDGIGSAPIFSGRPSTGSRDVEYQKTAAARTAKLATMTNK